MCGRYESWVDDDEVTAVLEMEKQGSAARYLRQTEVFPGTVQPVLYGSRIRMRAHLSKWGLMMRKDYGHSGQAGRPDAQLRIRDPEDEEDLLSAPNAGQGAVQGKAPRTFINARSETAAEKARFQAAFRDPERFGNGGAARTPDVRRVIVPTSGYYEWNGGIKYRICDRSGGLLFLAALEEDEGDLLRENARDPSKVFSVFSSSALDCSEDGAARGQSQPNPGRRHVILTAEAAGEPARIHSRMPLFLRREECEPWLYNPDFARMRLKRPWHGDLTVRAADA